MSGYNATPAIKPKGFGVCVPSLVRLRASLEFQLAMPISCRESKKVILGWRFARFTLPLSRLEFV